MKNVDDSSAETNLLTDIYEDFKNRGKSRIFPAYVFAWLCTNWKFVYLLMFANDENQIIAEKLNQYTGIVSSHLLIDQNIGQHNIYVFTPLVGAIAYVAIMPYVNVLFGWVQMFAKVWEHKLDISTENRKNAILKIKVNNLETEKGVLESEFELEVRKNPDMAKALAISKNMSEPIFKSIISKISSNGLQKDSFDKLVALKNVIGSAQYKLSDNELLEIQKSIEERLSNFEKGVLEHGKFDSYGRQELLEGLTPERIRTYNMWLNQILNEISSDYVRLNTAIHIKYPKLVNLILDGKSLVNK